MDKYSKMRLIITSFLVTIVLVITSLSCSHLQTKSADPTNYPEKPNIIFFIADDMYPEMFNCLPEGEGKNLTPNLDRLAAEGTIMVNQYVASPVCTPSRFNCLTGKYASRATNKQFLAKTQHEEGQTVLQWNSFITDQDSILPHYLRELGYVTGMVGKNHVIAAGGLERFPDFNADPRDPEIAKKIENNYLKVEHSILHCGFDYAGGIYHNNPDFIGVSELAVQNLDWITQAGVKFIDKYHENKFFLYFATTVPHGPTEPDRSWNANPKITARGFLDEVPAVMPARQTLPERLEKAGLGGTHKENVLWLDDALGALISKLEEYHILDKSIIFFFNDHGQRAKGTLYQGGALDPSIIWKAGGFPCGNICEAKISNVDFAPTILELAGGNPEKDFDGRSFKAALDGEEAASHESLYFELGYARAVIMGKYKYYAVRYPEYAKNWTAGERAAVLDRYNKGRTFRHMPIVNRDPEKPFSHLEVVPGGGQAENQSYGKKPGYFDPDQLYDLLADPGEMNNLAKNPEYREIVLEMKDELQKYLDDLPGRFDL
jgi:arylsulfatase A-like enzyme